MLGSETEVCPPAVIPSDVTYYACANVVLSSAQNGDGNGDGGAAVDAAGTALRDGQATGADSSATGAPSGGAAGERAVSGKCPRFAGVLAIAVMFFTLARRKQRRRSTSSQPNQ